MALKETRHCDVFGTAKDVHRCRVEIKRVVVSGDDIEGPPLLSVDKDLSPRGVRRLKSFINRATSPPGKVVAEAGEQKP